MTIAELLGCDPRTVRRWVHRYNAHGPNALADRPRSGRPRLGSRRLSARIRRLLAQPKAWTIPLLHLYPGRPAMSLRTLHRRVGEVRDGEGMRILPRAVPGPALVRSPFAMYLGLISRAPERQIVREQAPKP